MQVHSVRITAFGPFADEVEVDFSSLTDAGIFLLSGDTGAGKTTVLDAVCFALYGDVPSDRGAAKQLKSHHADPMARPEVVLEASVAGVRHRFTRSPAWQRPKKRGTGVTTEQARVLVETQAPGTAADGWILRTNRLDEAGLLVSDLLGMTLDQFAQVALLPQGQFDRFLRASSEERQRVLTQLFRTRRFEDVERWLTERRLRLRRAHEACERRVAALLHRLSEAGGVELPDEIEPAETDAVRRWSADLAESSHHAVSRARDRADAAHRDREHISRATDRARAVHALREQHAAATATLAELDADQHLAEADAETLDRALAARRVQPSAELARLARDRADQAQAETSRAMTVALEFLASDPGEPPGSAPDPAAAIDRPLAAATTAAARAQSFIPRAEQLADLRRRADQARDQLAALDRQRIRTTDAVHRIEDTVRTLTSRVESLRDRPDLLATARTEIAGLRRQSDAFASADRIRVQLDEATSRWQAEVATRKTATERLHSAIETRISGMAVELARGLAVGDDCPVCGSTDHPHPARGESAVTTRDEEEALRRAVDDAEISVETHADHRRGLQTRLEMTLEAVADLDPDQVEAALADGRQRAEALDRESADYAACSTALDQARVDREQLVAALTEVDRDHAVRTEGLQAITGSIRAIEAELSDVLGEAETLDELIAEREAAARTLTAARDALVEQRHRDEEAARAESSASTAATEAGFGTVDEAEAASLTGDAIQMLDTRLAARRSRRSAAEAVLAAADVVAALREPVPDLTAMVAASSEAETLSTHSEIRLVAAQTVERRLTSNLDDLAEALAAWDPVLVEHRTTQALASLVEGKSADNHLQMRLSAYVLVARLAQVVAAANERLGRMTDARFELEHSGQRGVGERRGGLSLQVRDNWTDQCRDPITLSGGETFVVALALALGLADVVTEEAGGTRIDTLFVDEGFGALDSTTLESVMDTLDHLREGGRSVGVVSHVTELRDRIPTQLRVIKHSTGSSIETRGVVGSGS